MEIVHVPELSPLEEEKQRILGDITGNRRVARLVEGPQIVVLVLLFIGLLSLASWGLFRSVTLLTGRMELNAFSKGVSVGCSLLGFVAIKLLPRMRQVCKTFLQEERLFTSQMHRVRLASSRAEIEGLLKEYCKPRPKSE